MDEIRVTLRSNRTDYRPGDTIEGSASWNLPEAPGAVEVRLVWFTLGKGTSDVSVADSSRTEMPATMGDTAFRFTLPDGPHSFSGQLISLCWAVEAVALSPKNKVLSTGRTEFVLSPDGAEIVLPKVEAPASATHNKFLQRKAEYLARQGKGPLAEKQEDPLVTRR